MSVTQQGKRIKSGHQPGVYSETLAKTPKKKKKDFIFELCDILKI